MGLLVSILGLLQPINGFLRPKKGGKVALSQLPPFLGFEQKYFNGEFLEH